MSFREMLDDHFAQNFPPRPLGEAERGKAKIWRSVNSDRETGAYNSPNIRAAAMA